MVVRKRRTVPEYVTRVEFALSDADYPFVAASSADGCRVVLEEFIPRGAGAYAEFFSVTGTDPDRVLSAAGDHESAEARLLNEYEDGGLFEFLVDGNCPAVFLSERNALPRDVFAVAGEGRLVAEIPSTENAAEIVDQFLAEHPDGDLVAKRDQPYVTPMFEHREYRHAVDERLTDRQQDVLAAAHEAGYYDWPREITGEELADELSIAPATLHKHLRAAERKLIAFLFEAPHAAAGH
jgi:hypothetical protein